MAVNIFEGARRISKLGAALWIVGVSFFTLTQNHPNIAATYTITAAGGLLVQSDPSCQYDSDTYREHIEVKTNKGTKADLTLCFSTNMKESVVTSPKGDNFAVTAPEVATEQQIMTYVQDVQSEVVEFEHRLQKERAAAKRPPTPREELETLRHLDKLESALTKAKAVGDAAGANVLKGKISKVREGMPAPEKQPQVIDVPGLGLVEFPGSMSDQDITAAIQKKVPVPPRERWRYAPIVQDGAGLVRRFKPFTGELDTPVRWDVAAYAKHVKKTFILPQADEEWIDSQWWTKWWVEVWKGALILVAGVVFLWGSTWTTGWILRGFLGIPRGQDRKTQ